MEISVSGDVYIAPELTGAVAAGEDLIRLMSGFDFNIVNLECPVVLDEGPRKIYKTGPHLKADASIFGFLRQLNVGVVTLANNHILDYGEKGLRQTLDTCGREGVLTVGAGMSLAEASAPLILEKSGIKVAIVNFCENEWSTASSTAAGANPMDFVDNLGQIRKARGMADFVIAVVHGGHERYNLPSPRMAKTYRFYAENGADAVIGHHTHCVSGFEIHGGVPIAYGLGNMLFTYTTDFEGWNTGLVARLSFGKDRMVGMDLISIRYDKNDRYLEVLTGYEKSKVLSEIETCCNIIQDEAALYGSWEEYIEKNSGILDNFLPMTVLAGRHFRAVLKRLGIGQALLTRPKHIGAMLNYIRCESHRDVLIGLISKRIK